jgi:hypothetical protein
MALHACLADRLQACLTTHAEYIQDVTWYWPACVDFEDAKSILNQDQVRSAKNGEATYMIVEGQNYNKVTLLDTNHWWFSGQEGTGMFCDTDLHFVVCPELLACMEKCWKRWETSMSVDVGNV